MRRKQFSAWSQTLLVLVGLSAVSHASSAAPLPGLDYHPEADAIVVRNGTRWDNRPLYCNARKMMVLAGEMPGISGLMGTLNVGVARGTEYLLLDQFQERVVRYRPGRMEWELRDSKLPGLTVKMTATTVPEGDGFVVRVQSSGAMAGDELSWRYFPAESAKGVPASINAAGEGLKVGRLLVLLSDSSPRTQAINFKLCSNYERLLDKTKPATDGGTGAEFIVPLNDAAAHDFAAVDPGSAKPLAAREAFNEGIKRVSALGKQVVVDTPDPYFNAGVSASCAAMYGLYVDPYFVHGGTAWRQVFPGWRVMDGATAYGWHSQVGTAAKFHSDRQVTKTDNTTKTTGEADEFGAEQSKNSRFYGLGKLTTGGRYDMQTQFFDQCVREWRSTGDAAFEKLLLPMLELHLGWAKECFDPDDDGLYESYINTWPTDAVWYNGGGSTEESAYIYYQRRAAAEMCLRAGRKEEASKHNAEADKIRDALNRSLWLKDKGQYAAYIEQGGLKRVHDDAWVYSEHLPIEAGLATPMQAWQAMYYTDWAMEHYRFPYGGEMRQTSNWVPGHFSVRALFSGDNFAMALGYFLAGQGDEGWELLKGAMLESMYGDPTPKAGYGFKAQYMIPGGLSCPGASGDFNDVTSMFCRSVVEGLFGYRPDYPNGIVTIAPSFPSAWDHASITTHDFSLAYKMDAATDRYDVGLTRPAKLRLRLPVRAENVKEVRVNGKPVDWKIEPWAGCGMLMLELAESAGAEIVVTLGKRVTQIKPIVVEKKAGESKAIAHVSDPQGCLGPDAKPGHHMAFARVERGNVPYLQIYNVNVTDPVGEAAKADKALRQSPSGAKWEPIAMTGLFNGNVREIFKQKYHSPRPATVSCRLAYNGYGTWTFKTLAPEPKLEKVPALLDKSRLLTTPPGAVFLPPAEGRNIAFTSLWDNWPRSVTVPVNKKGEAVWLLVCGSTNPLQGRIANAVLTFHYADGQDEKLDLVPPWNFWSLTVFGRTDYDYKRDGFALPKAPPPQVQLGSDCRAMVYGWKLRPDVELKDVTLETLSQDVVIGLMGVSVMNPQ